MAAKAKRRRFTAAFKLEVLREADRCTEPGSIGALLRRHGLYSSLLTTWRRERDQGALQQLERKRGRKSTRHPLDERVAQLEKENRRLQRRLHQAEAIIDVQKNHQFRMDHLLDQKLPLGYPVLPEWSGRQLTGDLRARKKTWSGGGRGLDIGDAERRSRLGK